MAPNSKKAFLQVMQHFADQAKSKKLFKKAEGLYLMRSYKITNIGYEQAQQSYERLQSKYDSGQLQSLTNDWHKNERKLFIWYLICYTELKKVSIQDLSDKEWEFMGHIFFGKNKLFLQFQGLSIIKNTKRHIWSTQDDELLKKYVEQINTNQWNAISKSLFFQNSGKFISAKQCRQRWFNHINKEVNKQKWTAEEDMQILKLSLEMGKKWAQIAKMLNTNRTQHMVKNRFNSKINKIRRKKIQNQQSLIRKALVAVEKQANQEHKERQVEQEIQQEQYRQEKQQKIQKKFISISKKQHLEKTQIKPGFSKIQKKKEQTNVKKDEQIQVMSIKQVQEELNISNLPQGQIKDISAYAAKGSNLIKGTLVFNQESQVGDNNEKGMVYSMTPNSVLGASPGFQNPFFTFDNFLGKSKDQGSQLQSPGPQYFPNIITCQSPVFDGLAAFKEDKSNLNLSRQFIGTPLFTPGPTDHAYDYKNYVSKWSSTFNNDQK